VPTSTAPIRARTPGAAPLERLRTAAAAAAALAASTAADVAAAEGAREAGVFDAEEEDRVSPVRGRLPPSSGTGVDPPTPRPPPLTEAPGRSPPALRGLPQTAPGAAPLAEWAPPPPPLLPDSSLPPARYGAPSPFGFPPVVAPPSSFPPSPPPPPSLRHGGWARRSGGPAAGNHPGQAPMANGVGYGYGCGAGIKDAHVGLGAFDGLAGGAGGGRYAAAGYPAPVSTFHTVRDHV